MKWNLLLGKLTQLLELILAFCEQAWIFSGFDRIRTCTSQYQFGSTAISLFPGTIGDSVYFVSWRHRVECHRSPNFLVFLKKDCNFYSEKEYSSKLCKGSEEIVYTLMYFTYIVVKIRWYQTVDSKFDSSSKLYTSDGYWRADLIRQPTDRNQRVLFIAGWAS